jgi:hypothetical protein
MNDELQDLKVKKEKKKENEYLSNAEKKKERKNDEDIYLLFFQHAFEKLRNR